jgi:hypothetical protein
MIIEIEQTKKEKKTFQHLINVIKEDSQTFFFNILD